LTAIYDPLAARYCREAHRRFYGRVVDDLVGEGDRTLRGRGLDLACGVGASTEPLRRAFPAVSWVGLDRSLAMLRRARRRPELADVPLVHAAAEALPLADASLRLCACSFALHWMGPAALSEIARVLAPGGRLLLAVALRAPAPALPGNRLLARAVLSQRRLVTGRPHAGFTVAEVEAALRAWQIHSLRVATVVERYSSGRSLLRSLETRGVLAALFGASAEHVAVRLEAAGAPAALQFGWPVALVAASPPARRRSGLRAPHDSGHGAAASSALSWSSRSVS
jgi:ubiquinone/menaquinone biosynthesis C-methylase UbiE